MRKIVAMLLSASLLLTTVFTAGVFSALGADSAEPSDTVTFAEDYYTGENPNSSHYHGSYLSVIDDEDPEHGKVLKTDRSGKWPVDDQAQWVPAFRVIGADGSPYRVTKDRRYIVTFDYKGVTMPVAGVKIGVLVKENTSGFHNTTGNGIQSSPSGQIGVGEADLGKWLEDGFVFIPKRDGELAFMFYGGGADGNTLAGFDLRVDNVRVAPYDPPVRTDVRLETDYYATTGGDTHFISPFVSVVDDDEVHGKVAAFDLPAIGDQASPYRRGIALTGENGAPIWAIKGHTYEVSYRIQTDFAGSFRVGTFNCPQADGGIGNKSNKWNAGSYLHTGATDGWKTETFTFTYSEDAADSGRLILAIYSDARQDSANLTCKIDDITVRDRTLGEGYAIGFDEAYYETHLEGGVGQYRYYPDYLSPVDSGDEAHGKAMKITRIGSKPAQGVRNWMTAVRLIGHNEQVFTLTKGVTYNITYDLKVVKLPDTVEGYAGYKHDFNIGLVASPGQRFWRSTDNLVSASEVRTVSYTEDTKDDVLDRWFTDSFNFTPDKDGEAALLFYFPTGASDKDVEIWLDNVRVSRAAPTRTAQVDFSGKNYTAPLNNAAYVYSSVVQDDAEDSTHGEIWRVEDQRAPMKGSAWPGDNYMNWRSNFALYDENGRFVQVEPGHTYGVRFEIRTPGSEKPFGFAAFNTLNGLSGAGTIVGGPKWFSGEAVYSGGDTEGRWQTLNFTFTVPEDTAPGGRLMLGLFSSEHDMRVSFDLDNVLVYEIRAGEPGFETNFSTPYYLTGSEKSGSVFHSGVHYFDTYMQPEKADDAHGVVMAGYTFSPNPGTKQSWVSALRLTDSDGETYPVTAGKRYTVTYEYKANTDTPLALSAICKPSLAAGSVVDAQFGNASTTSGFVSARQDIPATENGDWQTGGFTFTADRDGEASLVFACDGAKNFSYPTGGDRKICVDNVRIEPAEEAGEAVEVRYHNFRGPDDGEVTTYTDITGLPYHKPYVQGKQFAGWFRDAGLLSPAPETVTARCTELWAKWEDDTRVAATVTNTYDEENVTFTNGTSGEGDGLRSKVDYAVGGGQTADFAEYNVRVEQTKGPDGQMTGAVHFLSSAPYNSGWPPAMRVYDPAGGTFEQSKYSFMLHANSAYRIRFDYRVDTAMASPGHFQLIRMASTGIGNPFIGGYDATQILHFDLAAPNAVTESWVSAEATFYTGSSNAPVVFSLVDDHTGNTRNPADVWVDNLQIEELLDVAQVATVNPGTLAYSEQSVIVGDPMPPLPAATQPGKIFTGWYTDYACTQPFETDVVSSENLTLYAGFTDSQAEITRLETGFETSDYDAPDVYPNPFDAAFQETHAGKTGNVMSKEVAWATGEENNVEAHTGNGSLYVDFFEGGVTSASQRYASVAVLNKDGSNYQIVAGERYHVRFYVRFAGNTGGLPTLILASAADVPSGVIGSGALTQLASITDSSNSSSDNIHGIWTEVNFYFIAPETEKLYFALYASKEACNVNIDDLLIEEATGDIASVITWYKGEDEADGVQTEMIGAIGEEFVEPDATSPPEGKEFNGWRDEDGNVVTINHYPQGDRKYFATYKDAQEVTGATSDFSEPLFNDFEDAVNQRIFYGGGQHNYGQGYTYLVSDDPGGAHSGSSYMKFNKAGHWIRDWYRRWQFYDPNSADHLVHLEPNSDYLVTYWINIERCGDLNLYMAAFTSYKDNEYYIAEENYMTEASQFGNMGQWVQRTNHVHVDDDPVTLGFVLYGGYLTAKIDDITITKLKPVTVTYQTNCDQEIPPTEMMSYDTLMAPDDPVREGYTFGGWYTDPECTNKFAFNETLVTEDMTLYAKWTKNATDEPENPGNGGNETPSGGTGASGGTGNNGANNGGTGGAGTAGGTGTSGGTGASGGGSGETEYETYVEYEQYTETVETPVPDPELDEQIGFQDNDPVGEHPPAGQTEPPAGSGESDGGGLPWWAIVLIAAGGLLLAGGAVFAVLMIRRKRSDSAR